MISLSSTSRSDLLVQSPVRACGRGLTCSWRRPHARREQERIQYRPDRHERHQYEGSEHVHGRPQVDRPPAKKSRKNRLGKIGMNRFRGGLLVIAICRHLRHHPGNPLAESIGALTGKRTREHRAIGKDFSSNPIDIYIPTRYNRAVVFFSDRRRQCRNIVSSCF